MKSAADNFIVIPFTVDNLDLFVVRNAILNALKYALPLFKGKLLDVGCGKMPYKDFIFKNSSVSEYIGLDIESALEYDVRVKPDFTWNGINMPFEDQAFDCLMATEVLEHCPDPLLILRESHRVLKPGGVFFFTTPFLWNLHEVPHDEYRFTPFSLERLLRTAGFKSAEVNASGGWHTSMAQMLGLWVRRSPMSGRNRKFLSMILKPIIKKLLKLGANAKIDFKKGPMISTMYGIARK